jgi:hypothetical protein
MASHALFDAFLDPAVQPNQSHACAVDVVGCRASADGLVVQEIYRRPNALFGFRYLAWVAWRDAGSTPRSHSWHGVDPDQALVTDDYATACEVAERHAVTKGLRFSPWGTSQ